MQSPVDVSVTDMSAIFRCIKGGDSFSVFPEVFIEAMIALLTAKHIAAAATAVPDQLKTGVRCNFSKGLRGHWERADGVFQRLNFRVPHRKKVLTYYQR